MNITIISPFSFGYIDALVQKLEGFPNVNVIFIQTGKFNFKYDSFLQQGHNFLLKSFKNRNLKLEFKTEKILQRLQNEEIQDHILIIRPDLLEENLLSELKLKTRNFISFYYDAIENIPEKSRLIKYFDTVYSFEKYDVEKYGLKFITNFIPEEINLHSSESRGVFNVSSFDDRAVVVEKIANQLKENNFPFKFFVKHKKEISLKYIEVIQEYMSLDEVKGYLRDASILLDIQKEDQQGLSFRVLEALGYNKKLITTNQDVKNYDFFRPENILIIDKINPEIPKEFLIEPIHSLPEKIKYKYSREAWIKEVFGL